MNIVAVSFILLPTSIQEPLPEKLVPNEKHAVGGPIECAFALCEGLPQYMDMSYPPEYEKARSVVSEAAASEAAVVAAGSLTGWPRVVAGAQKPRYRIPDFGRLPNAMTARHRRLAEEKKACLVTEVSVNDATTFDPDKKRYERFVQVYIDAETGKAVAVLPAYLMRGEPSTRKTAVSPDAEWSCGGGRGRLSPAVEDAPASGKEVLLRSDEGGWLLARYDGKTNRLFYKADGGTTVLRPDPALARGLRAYKPSRHAQQPAMAKP